MRGTSRTDDTKVHAGASPRAVDLLQEGIAGARSQRAATITAVAVLAIVCFVVLVTTGQSAAAEQQIISRIDSVGTRLIAVSDDSGNAGILSEGIAQVEEFTDATWVLGLGPVTDVVNLALPSDLVGVAARPVVGRIPPDLRLTAGRMPRPGEAIAGVDAAKELSLADGRGTVAPSVELQTGQDLEHDARVTPVVGTFEATGPLDTLNSTVLVATAPTPDLMLRYVYVMADDVGVTERLGATLRSSLPAIDPLKLHVETPSGAVALREVIAGDLGASSRRLMAVVLAVGVAIVAVTMLGAVSAKRRDFGRRRALGATRSSIVVLVLVQTAVAAVIGTALGTTAGVLAVGQLAGSVPSARFVGGVAGLTIIVALLGAVPPALAAACRDPMRILRVP